MHIPVEFAILMLAVLVLAAFFMVREVIKLKLPNFGRIGSAILLLGGTLLDQFNALPWGTILSDSEAKAVGFAIAVGMMFLHVADMVKNASVQDVTPPSPKV